MAEVAAPPSPALEGPKIVPIRPVVWKISVETCYCWWWWQQERPLILSAGGFLLLIEAVG